MDQLLSKAQIGGKSLGSIARVTIHQELFKHNSFEVVLPMSSVAKVQSGDDPFKAMQALVGKEIEINFGSAKRDNADEKVSFTFKGIVTNLNVHGGQWEHSMVSVLGSSPTILMDGIAHNRAYSEKTISAIYKEAIGKHLSGSISLSDNCSHSDKLPYTVQSGESDFQFLRRLCYEYGQPFYFNGVELCIGHKPNEPTVGINKSWLQNIQYEYVMAPTVPPSYHRDYLSHKVVEVKPKKASSSDRMAGFMIKESDGSFPGWEACHHAMPSFDSKDSAAPKQADFKHKSDVENKVRKSGVTMLTIDTINTSIRLGSQLKIEGFQHSGDFVVIAVSHLCKDGRNYTNKIKAIPKDALYPEVQELKASTMQSCVAVVSNNKDPEKLGRVKVLFDWAGDVESPWLRATSVHAGDTRGFYFIPEVGDEVMVGFEGGRAEHPYIIGALYNGKNKFDASYHEKNNIKSIKTRSGNEIVFDDNGKITIRNENNTLELTCADDGEISITTNGNMVLNAKKNVSINAGENMTLAAGKAFKVSAGKDASLEADGKIDLGSGKAMTLEASQNFTAKAGASVKISGTQNAEVSGLAVKFAGQTQAELSAGAMTTIKGGLVKIN